VTLLWGIILDYLEWRILRRALHGSFRNAPAAGIFRGHFRSAVCGPWRSPRLAIQLIFFGLVWHFHPAVESVAVATALSLLFVCARTDGANGSIPAELIYLGLAAGLIFSLLKGGERFSSDIFLSPSAQDALRLAATDGLLTTAVLFWVAITFEALFQREGLGFGDVQLAAVLGLFFGFGGALRVFFFGSLLALAVWCGQLILPFPTRSRLRPGQPLPFAPYLLAGAVCQSLSPFLRLG
jgi:prepilin signal peptidase PulO-like enzyme (type II secretory pathway)